jgi:hypothetical protein
MRNFKAFRADLAQPSKSGGSILNFHEKPGTVYLQTAISAKNTTTIEKRPLRDFQPRYGAAKFEVFSRCSYFNANRL